MATQNPANQASSPVTQQTRRFSASAPSSRCQRSEIHASRTPTWVPFPVPSAVYVVIIVTFVIGIVTIHHGATRP